ncbi:MAG TPA: MFS transporter [Afipia sp.]
MDTQTNATSAADGEPSPTWTERGTRIYRRTSVALFLAGFVTFSAVYAVQPLLPELASDFGVSAAQSSLALSLTTALLAAAILCAGAGSEMFGRRGLMFTSMCCAALLNIALAFVSNWHGLLALRALEGFVLGGVPAVAMAYLAEEIHPKGLGLTMGLYVGGTAFGGMAGRFFTGVIAELASWRTALGVLGLLDLILAVIFILLLPPSRNFERQLKFDASYHLRAWADHLRDRNLLSLFVIGGLVMGAFVTIYNYVTFRLVAPPYELSQTQIGSIFTVYLFGTLASWLAGALSDRLGRAPVLIAGTLIFAAGIAITLLPSLAAIITGIALLTSGFFVTHTVASGWVGRLATNAKGHAASLYLLVYYTGSSIMGSLGGWFWAADGWPAVAGFAGVLIFLAFVAAVGLSRSAPAE